MILVFFAVESIGAFTLRLNAQIMPEEDYMKLTRRRLLQAAGGIFTAGVFPRPMAAAGDPASPVMAKLSTYMSEARNRALPEEALEKAKHHILDTFAAMISGAALPPGRAAIQFARA